MPLCEPRGQELVQQVLDAALRDGEPEVICRHVFERMGFIEDHHLVIREQAAAGPP